MSHAHQLAAARAAVQIVLGECAMYEVILIEDGYYAGHRFVFQGGYAVWFLDEPQVTIHRHEGTLLKAVNLVGRDEQRAA